MAGTATDAPEERGKRAAVAREGWVVFLTDGSMLPSMDTAEKILREFSKIAVVGASRDPQKEAHAIPAALLRAGFEVTPVNPYAKEVFGKKCYSTLGDVPAPLQIVLVFRPSADATAVVKDALAHGAQAIWLQQGIVSKEGAAAAKAAGILYVEDRCIGVVRSVHKITKQSAG
ncbi:MAG: CoA-binding protein [Polyangiaceae bacterium]|nr:CoA-binding protein [Polyangiaceae bacterium]